MVLAVFLLALAGKGIASDGPVRATLSYEQTEDRAAFIAAVRKARQGDSEAQWHVGRTYAGLGADAQALPMLLSAATSGHVSAASLAASFYEDGRGVPKDLGEALRWYRQAAEQGEPASMAALARLLPAGDPLVLNYLRRSAEAGDADGQYQLGLFLARQGPAQNVSEALDWFVKAGKQGHLGAQVASAAHLLEGKGVKADRQAGVALLERAARLRDPVANYLLGQAHLTAGKPDPEAARPPLRVAAMAGHREAQYLYGTLLAQSKVAEDRREAQEWLEKAQKTGHVVAANRLGELLRQFERDPQQVERARALFLQAAEQGNVDAMYNFAVMQNQGLGGPRDTFAALKWFNRAAEENHERAAEVLEDLLGSTIKTSSLGLKGFWQK